MRLIVQRLESVTSFDSIWDEWCALETTIEPRTPFSSPVWNKLWWKHLSRKDLRSANEFFFHTVRNADGKLLAVAPWMITRRPGLPPLQLRILTCVGSDATLTEVRGIICRREDEIDVVRALFEYLADGNFEFDAVEWHGLRSYEAREILETEAYLSYSQASELYVLPLPQNWEVMWKRLSSYARKYFRRSQEKLEAAGLQLQLSAVEEKAEIVKSMDNFFALHALRAEAKDMLPHPNKFKNHSSRSFIVDIFTTLAGQGKVRVFEARIGEELAACRLAFILDSTLYVYFSGYEPKWQPYSVGTLMMIEIIRWSIENGFKVVNLSTGRDRAKLQWRPTEYVFQGGVRFGRNYSGKMAIRVYGLLNSRRRIPDKVTT